MAISTGGTDATSSSSLLERKGCIRGEVLSVFDLPVPDNPIAVSLSTCGISIKSGPPLSRHKNHNSYRFSPTPASESTNNDVIKLVAPLSELYQSDLRITVLFLDERNNFFAELPLRQLRVHENKWLILNLSSTTAPAVTVLSNTNRSRKVEEGDVPQPPTIRIKLKLCGPYRPEIEAIINAARLWFGIVDSAQSTLGKAPKLPNRYSNWMLLPILPAAAVIIVTSPVILGLVALVIPFLFPIVVALVGVVLASVIFGGILYISTKEGRGRLNLTVGPLLESFVFSRSGQALMYSVGPRPTPVSICRQVLPDGFWSKLSTSLLIDFIGSSSYLLPVVGEGFDLAWAPAQTVLIMAMYDSTSPNLKYVSFLEEVLPFTDIVPSATIGWACEFIPILWNKHNEINNVAPEVTRTVTQLVTTAANAAMMRKRAPAATK